MKYVAPAIMKLGRVSIQTKGCTCASSDGDDRKAEDAQAD